MTQALATAEQIPGVSPEIFNASDFAEVSRIVYETSGIVLPQGKSMLVYSRLAPLVRESATVTFAKYIARMRGDPAEMNRAVAALTTNHTFFYREAHHFEHLRDHTRGELLRKLEAGQGVRIWSAGCSSGEETWSIVMTLLGPDKAAGRRIAGSDLRVLASDLAPHAIARGTAAIYPARDISPVPRALAAIWTANTGDDVRIDELARSLVRFRLLNLLGPWPMKRRFDVIFCRNVMIYFDNPTKERLVQRFADALLPGGYLYIGHSERVTGTANADLQLVGPTIYRRRGA